MPSEASKCSTPYTSNCVGNAKALHSQGQPASPAAASLRMEPNTALFALAGGITLYVRIDGRVEKDVSGSFHLGAWPEGKRFAFFRAPIDRVRIDDDLSVWFGSTNVEMPWAELIKLAHFLHLDIPQPELPAGQEVPR